MYMSKMKTKQESQAKNYVDINENTNDQKGMKYLLIIIYVSIFQYIHMLLCVGFI